MRTQENWGELLRVEPEFLVLESAILSGKITDYREIPPGAFSWHAWDMIPHDRLFKIILPFLRQQLLRASEVMPAIYKERLDGIEPGAIFTPNDWYQVPVLVKDDDPTHSLRGFRAEASANPGIMQPRDMQAPSMTFGSGGTSGTHTPTFVSIEDRDREVQGWRRGHDYHGLGSGDRVLYTYNTTHKGGQWMQESLWIHGVQVNLRRPEEGPEQVLRNIRAYRVNVLFTVQQPYEALHQQEKSAGTNLHSLVEASLEKPEHRGLLVPDMRGQRQIDFVFLGGFEIVPYAIQLAQEYLDCVPIATLLGSSEAIPQACSTNPSLTPTGTCHYNNLHLLHGPHYIEVVKPMNQAWVPVEKGEEGLLVYTSWARDGTIWIRYAPGDVATLLMGEGECPCGLQTPVISGVHRKDLNEQEALLVEGCAAG